jgi:hypothetical protein
VEAIRVTGKIEERGRLVASIPDSIEPGMVEVLIIAKSSSDDDAGETWMAGVAREWHEELNDARQDIYTLADGVPIE